MAQELRLDIKGLSTNGSPLAGGTNNTDILLNVNVDAPSEVSSRRGFYPSTAALAARCDWVGEFDGALFGYCPSLTTLYKYNGSAWVSVGTVTPADSTVGFRDLQYNGSLYFTDDEGIKKLDSATASIRDSGVSAAISLATAFNGSSGFMANNTQVSYRAVFGYTDSNGVVILGSPSERADVVNATGGTRNVDVTVYRPDGISAGYFVQLYRSETSSGVAVQADDELGLVYERVLVAGDISTGYVTITDIVIDSLRGATIYTAPSQEGIGASNDRPPRSVDMTLYKGCAFYANTVQAHVLYLNLVSTVAASGGFAVNDTITINGIVYTGKASENVTNAEFKVFTTGSAGNDLSDTARSLCKIINLYTGNTVIDAFYISGYDDLPGKMAFKRADFVNTPFYAVSSRGGAFSPILGATGTATGSAADVKAARVYFSKPEQPEAVPYGFYFDAGSSDWPIVRIVALRDSVFCFKSNGEIWVIRGEDPGSFSIRVHDSTAMIYGPRTAAVFNNEIYCMSDQGIISVSDAGVSIKSYAVEDQISRYLSPVLFSSFETTSWGLAYPSDRSYLLFAGDKVWRYNVITGSWSNWDLIGTAGYHDSDLDTINFVQIDDKKLWVERKNYDLLDYCDNQTAVTVVSFTGPVVTLASVSGITAGQGIYQGTVYGVISSVSVPDSTVTLETTVSFTAGTAYIVDPITCTLTFSPIHGGNPAVMKRFREFLVMFKDMSDEFTSYMTTNFDSSSTLAVVADPTFIGQGWGDFPWGDVPWGGALSGSQETRIGWPVRASRGLWGNVSIVTDRPFTRFSVIGLSVLYDMVSTRFEK